MIVITNPTYIENEVSIIHSLFEEGLSLLHIRKPDFTESEMIGFVSAIKMEYRTNLVLHNHHQIMDDLGINRIHFSEKDRVKRRTTLANERIVSTSTHSIEDFNFLQNDFEYAFLSPVFSSISKVDYHPKVDLFEKIKQRTNFNSKIIALGGIDAHNIVQTLENGFDAVALLGAIWNHPNPIKNFKLCQKNALSY